MSGTRGFLNTPSTNTTLLTKPVPLTGQPLLSFKKTAEGLFIFTTSWYTLPTMVVRMRATKGHRNNRRAHHKLENPTLSVCADCKAPKLSHTACPSCGKYKGKKVV